MHDEVGAVGHEDPGAAHLDGTCLDGTWRATVADDANRRVYHDVDFDDSDWTQVAVPGHWRDSPEFATQDGPLLYRTKFKLDQYMGDWRAPRSWLVLHGVFYTSDIWLDGTYLGDTEGYFFPHSFEVSDLLGDPLTDRDQHLLALEVACAPQDEPTRKRNLTGWFQSPISGDTEWNPGGIWRQVRVEHSGPVRIRHMRVLCRDADVDSATVFIRAVLDTTEACDVEVRTRVAGRDQDTPDVESTTSHPLAAGENRLEWTVTVADPKLWWPASLGDQPLYDVDIEVSTDDRVSDRRTRRTGLRSIELRNWICSVNGEQIFLKGALQGPNRRNLATATRVELERDLDLALDAGLDMLRLHTHVNVPQLYDMADEKGLLIWQDLPLHRGYSTSVRAQARRQAREAVDLLGHHPSVIIWCGHDEPFAIDASDASLDETGSRRRALARTILRAALGTVAPSWNKTILDHSVRSVLNRSDGTRPVIAHSGVLPHPPRLDGTDTHLWLGWLHGDGRDLPRLLRLWPRLARFITGFGAQSVPPEAGFLAPENWPDIDWNRVESSFSAQRCAMDAHVSPRDHGSFDSWRRATQDYQAELLRHQILTVRRLKYRPCGGFVATSFADPEPAISTSVLDHERNPKTAMQALVQACAPLVVAADRLPAELVEDDEIDIAVHVVSDLRVGEGNLIVRARLAWSHAPDTAIAGPWEWWGEAAADSCTRVGSIALRAPSPSSVADHDNPAHSDPHLRVTCELWRHGGSSPIATTWDETPVVRRTP